MAEKKYLLALDAGTTSVRSMVFDAQLQPVATAQQEFPQHYPAPGHVEHACEDIWQAALATLRGALDGADIAPQQVAALGLTNQRETSVLWHRGTGKPLHNAIVWQDRRTAPACAALRDAGHEPQVQQKTGLLLDPYFSATKIGWLLDNVAGARAAAQAGELAFGTIDSFLLWRLTGGAIHATDATNASRTMLMNLETSTWDDGLLALFGVPRALLPEIRDCVADYGKTLPALLGCAVPILGVAGDQQAAALGQACVAEGMLKATYGTGCFALLHTGTKKIISRSRLLTTLACQLGGQRRYALEGSIFMAGATVQWLRDKLKIITTAAEVNALAAAANTAEDVYLVPAFVGLGAPWWDAGARASLQGLTRNAGAAEIARAALEAVGYQTRDLLEAMRADWADAPAAVLRVDGGMSASDMTMQFLADILDAPVDRPAVMETTARGAAWLAGAGAGLLPQPLKGPDSAAFWQRDRRFTPAMDATTRTRKWQGWQRAIRRTLSAT